MEPISETERMVIRPLFRDDTPALARILSDPEVMRHSVSGVRDEAGTRKFIEWCLACYASHGVGPWALIEKRSRSLIGICGVGPEQVEETEEFNLGYRLGRSYWGVGLATESVRAVLSYTFDRKGLDSVVVIIEPGHIASRGVAEKVGFTIFRKRMFHGRDARIYRMTREAWFKLDP